MTGVRIGELCGLKMKDISLAEKTLAVNRTVQRIYNKQKQKSYINIGLPKTSSSVRTIPLPSLLVNIVRKFYTENPEHYFLTGKTSPTEPRTYRQFFFRFLKRNNLKQVKFHEIRHTFAVRCIEIPDFDVKSLSEILGHKNVSFTLNVYGSANLKQKIRCMNLLNDLLWLIFLHCIQKLYFLDLFKFCASKLISLFAFLSWSFLYFPLKTYDVNVVSFR